MLQRNLSRWTMGRIIGKRREEKERKKKDVKRKRKILENIKEK